MSLLRSHTSSLPATQLVRSRTRPRAVSRRDARARARSSMARARRGAPHRIARGLPQLPRTSYTRGGAELFYGATLIVATWRGQPGCEATLGSNWILGRDEKLALTYALDHAGERRLGAQPAARNAQRAGVGRRPSPRRPRHHSGEGRRGRRGVRRRLLGDSSPSPTFGRDVSHRDGAALAAVAARAQRRPAGSQVRVA